MFFQPVREEWCEWSADGSHALLTWQGGLITNFLVIPAIHSCNVCFRKLIDPRQSDAKFASLRLYLLQPYMLSTCLKIPSRVVWLNPSTWYEGWELFSFVRLWVKKQAHSFVSGNLPATDFMLDCNFPNCLVKDKMGSNEINVGEVLSLAELFQDIFIHPFIYC